MKLIFYQALEIDPQDTSIRKSLSTLTIILLAQERSQPIDPSRDLSKYDSLAHPEALTVIKKYDILVLQNDLHISMLRGSEEDIFDAARLFYIRSRDRMLQEEFEFELQVERNGKDLYPTFLALACQEVTFSLHIDANDIKYRTSRMPAGTQATYATWQTFKPNIRNASSPFL